MFRLKAYLNNGEQKLDMHLTRILTIETVANPQPHELCVKVFERKGKNCS